MNWIKVEERLPDKHKIVTLQTNKGKELKGSYYPFHNGFLPKVGGGFFSLIDGKYILTKDSVITDDCITDWLE